MSSDCYLFKTLDEEELTRLLHADTEVLTLSVGRSPSTVTWAAPLGMSHATNLET